MLEIHWDLLGPVEGPGSDFTLGDLTLRGSRGTVTTKDRRPSRSMMVFPSLVNMLDEVWTFLVKGRPGCTVSTVASPFEITLARTRDEQIVVKAGGVEIDVVSRDELVRAVWDAAQEVLREHRDAFGCNAQDLAAAEEQFVSAFGDVVRVEKAPAKDDGRWRGRPRKKRQRKP